jgi:hypothetical protein
MFGHPALRLLIRIKAKAAFRSQWRRLKRPSSWVFAILGLLLMLSWISSVLVSGAFRPTFRVDYETAVFGAQAGISVLMLMTVFGAFNHRGIYLPKEEIELVFSAPVSRGEIVRYRLLVNLLRSVIAGVIFGIGVARQLQSGLFAFSGVLLTMLTLPILGQALSLLLGDAENRFGKLLKKLPLRVMSTVLGIIVGLGVASLFIEQNLYRHALGESTFAHVSLDSIIESPFVSALLWPTKPWALMIAARDAPSFFPWFFVCLALWAAAFELTARIPVDFRELSLATSADVAQRLRRLRRGGIGAGVTSISKETLAWRVPWIFGRKTFGAIAWLKSAAILRKARGTFVVSALIIAFLTLLFTYTFHGGELKDVLGGATLIATVGTIYLCSGLRFDFRNDLEQMELVKAFPLAPAWVFLATILPEVVLVAALLAVAIFARAFFTGDFHPLLIGIIAAQPLVTLGWVAIDNVVFLFAPVRYTPGQEGALQHTGRSVLLALVRFTALLVALLLAAAPGALAGFACTRTLAFSREASMGVGLAVMWLGLFAIDAALVFAGGIMLRRFDVARDRG